MISMRVADMVNCAAQIYITNHFICKLWKPRYNYLISNLITCFWGALIYIRMTFIVSDEIVVVRILSGLFLTVLYAIIILDGAILQNIVRGTVYFTMFAILEVVLMVLINLCFTVSYYEINFNMNLLFARQIFTLSSYLFIVILQFFINLKKSQRVREIAFFSIILAICEIISFCILVYVVWEKSEEYLIVISGFYTVLVLIGYHITSEMFYEIIRQQEKKNELEQRVMERQHQYDYYMLAKEQAEQARDLRHDMRNQLQTVQCLIQNEDKKERQRAREMVKNLSNRVEGLLEE